jgi:hypothetical protein
MPGGSGGDGEFDPGYEIRATKIGNVSELGEIRE